MHRFENSIDGVNVNPGEEFDYLFGVGFAANSWITISGTVLGSTITRYGVNGVSIPGSDQDPIRFRIAVTVVKDSRICEPFAEIAMTPDAPSRSRRHVHLLIDDRRTPERKMRYEPG